MQLVNPCLRHSIVYIINLQGGLVPWSIKNLMCFLAVQQFHGAYGGIFDTWMEFQAKLSFDKVLHAKFGLKCIFINLLYLFSPATFCMMTLVLANNVSSSLLKLHHKSGQHLSHWMLAKPNRPTSLPLLLFWPAQKLPCQCLFSFSF